MIVALFAVQVLLVVLVGFALLRGRPAVQDSAMAELAGRVGRLDAYVRESVAELRRQTPEEAVRTRGENAEAARALRTEVMENITTLGGTLGEGLDGFRADNKASAEQLRQAVELQMDALKKRLSDFIGDTNQQNTALREAINQKLSDLMHSNGALQEKLRAIVEERLNALNSSNAEKLEQMRMTVEEKLEKTLHTRLTASFGQVTTHLGEVQKGLGEMRELANGVTTLNKVFTNVSKRGGFAEVQLGMQLEQILAPDQFIKNAQIKPSTGERVEYAIRFPKGQDEQVLLSIDAKFPKEDWERLEAAQDSGVEVQKAGEKFESAIRRQAKLICDKYIDPPTTLPYAIMYLPTESLYAEVLRRPGLLSDLQSTYRVTVAGPTTLMSILSNCQMLFYALSFQKRSDEVWKVLALATKEFNNFSNLMGSVTDQVGTVQRTLNRIKGKTTTINRALKNVVPSTSATATAELEEIAGIVPLLAAEEEPALASMDE